MLTTSAAVEDDGVAWTGRGDTSVLRENCVSCLSVFLDCPSSRSCFESLAGVYSGFLSGSVGKSREVSPCPKGLLK